MDLDIQSIADAKIKAMHESGEIKKRIEDDIEKPSLLQSTDRWTATKFGARSVTQFPRAFPAS